MTGLLFICALSTSITWERTASRPETGLLIPSDFDNYGDNEDNVTHCIYHFAMRFHAVLAVPLLICSALGGQMESKFMVEITPSQNATQPGIAVWKKGAPVFFIITMKNNSEYVLHFALTNPAFNYRSTVLDSRGRRVTETENYRKLRQSLRNGLPRTTRNVIVELKPHETRSDTIEISYLYDLSQPGQYTVRLERDLPPEIGSGVVSSNKVNISVEE